MVKDLILFLFLVITLYSAGMGMVLAATNETPHQEETNVIDMFVSYSHEHTADGIHTTVQILLGTRHIPLNAFEVEVMVDDERSSIVSISPLATLCEEQFIIENSIDDAKKSAHSICGSRTPFVTDIERLPILEIELFTAAHDEPTVTLGDNTGFYIHDGFGTRATTHLGNVAVGV